MSANDLDARTISAMQSGTPYSSYRKTILGKVYVTVLNSFSGVPEGLILQGEHGADDTIVNLWSEREDVFFRRSNKRQIDVGNIIVHIPPSVDEAAPKSIEQYSDEELRAVVNQNYFKFQKSTLPNITSEAVLLRMLDIAKAEEKSEKVMNQIKSRLSDVQGV